MKFFNYFDKAYCINLEKRNDRLVNFIAQVKTFDLGEFERIVAIDGQNIYPKDYKSKLLSGEIGLALSVKNILENAIMNNYDSILILEDDCIFTNEIKIIHEYFKLLPNDWDMVYFGGNHNTHAGHIPPAKMNDKVCKLHHTYSSHCIGIKSNIYKNILNLLKPLNNPIDVVYTKIQKIFNVYSFYPAIAKQYLNYSDILHKEIDYNKYIK